MSPAVLHAKKIGEALARRPGSIALRKAVWRELAPLRRAMLACSPSHGREGAE